MRRRWIMMAVVLSASATVGTPACARGRHSAHAHGHHSLVHHDRGVRYGFRPNGPGYPPLSGTVGTPIPPYAARFMGYPYNVPGYRYEYADGCLLRVGGVFGPGPSIAPCPFGADRPF